jgi:hypothetical protein
VDIELTLPSTSERAFVQVKSATSQRELDEYLTSFETRNEDRMFYVYHTAKGSLETGEPGVTVVGPQRLAEMTLQAGLVDWLLAKLG